MKQTTPNKTKVNSIDHLYELVNSGVHDFELKLNCIMRSSKYITLGEQEGTLEVMNLIDDSVQVLTREELNNAAITNIGKAIENGVFWAWL